MELKASMRSRIKAARARRSVWVRIMDFGRLLPTAEGRANLWTRIVHHREVHQTTSYTCEERYPALFDLAAVLAPDAKRILSFGCSTGEELMALRRRFVGAEIIGAEINPRSRAIARRRLAADPRAVVLHPRFIRGSFDVVFALAVLQREPHKIAEMEVEDLTPFYSHERFDAAVRELGGAVRIGGLLCVINAHYRIEDSSIARQFETIASSPPIAGPVFGPNGRPIDRGTGRTIFRKRQ